MRGIYKNYVLGILFLGLNFSLLAQCPTLVWSDEFDGNSLDLTKWEPQIGDGCDISLCGWGNNELQYYKAENAVVSNGTLKIIAKKERVKSKGYTSARLRSKGLGDFTFGRFEARIKLMTGQGFWPAFWMLSTNEPYGGWPQSGEIDIMEYLGQETEKTFGTIHYGDLYPNNQFQGRDFLLYDGSTFDQDFHVFAVEWEAGEIRWYVDDILFSTKTSADIAPYNWPFDATNQMHFLLNLAVGGNLPGDPDSSTPFPSQMEVDYVRVYDLFSPSISGDRLVSNQEPGVTYTINNAGGGSSFSWSVPAGATVSSGANSNQVTVDWGATSGDVICNVTTNCITKSYKINVTVEPPFIYDFSFENFDQPANVTFSSVTGQLTEVSNPNASGVNTTANVAEYVRNNQEQYDVIAYSTSSISDAGSYKHRLEKFYMDVLTSAPIGTEIIVQLENSTEATSSNYPTGRHSRYSGKITQNGAWQRIEFDFLDAPDGATSDTGVDQIIILFASNSFTGDTYYWDNFDSYTIDDGSGPTNNPPVASFTYQANNLSVDFNASGSSDSDGSITSYQWDFGDGNSGSGEIISHTYAASGDYTVTLTVEDNEAAIDSDVQTVSVSEGGGAAVSVHVQSIVTGTQSVGQGNKRGTATVVVHDNNESPVQGVTVSGTFSGTFSESVSGVTDASGSVTLVTSATAKGGVSVGFCVDNLVDGSLVYDNSLNDITCVGSGGARFDNSQDELENPFEFTVYPNPFTDQLSLRTALKTKSEIRLQIFDISGQKVYQSLEKLSVGNQEISFNLANLESGIYFLDIVLNSERIRQKIVKK